MLTSGKRFFPSNPEALARFAPLVNSFLIILLAHSLATLSWDLLYPSLSLPDPAIEESVISPSTPIKNGQGVDFTIIAGWHLFGQADTVVSAPTPVEAPETKLNLKLVGIFFAEDNTRALALIAEPNGEEHSYRVGDLLPGGARLEQVFRDYIVLQRNGRQEKLSLPKESADIDAASTASKTPPYQTSKPDTASTVQTIDARAIASRLRGEVVTRPQALQDLALATPYMENGQFKGFRLRPGKDRALFQQLGLRVGDIITQINGSPLESPAQGLSLLQELLSTNQVNLQVVRRGNEIPLNFFLGNP